MTTFSRLLAVPIAMAAMIATASASEVIDGARMFSPEGIRRAEKILDRAAVPVVIETIESLNGRSGKDEAISRAKSHPSSRVYVLISKADAKFHAEERGARFTQAQGEAIRQGFVAAFNKRDFDGGLVAGSEAIASAVSTWSNRPVAAPGRGGRAAPVGGGGGGMSFLLVIGGIVLAVLIGTRVIGALFGGSRGQGYGPAQGMGGPGMGGPGMGYGGGYGGGGGGFFSSLLGGIGGAVAGNWMYDQFRGRGHDSGYTGGDATGGAPPEDAGWGGDVSGDWGDSGGGDVGGDWGGGGGGDWGGGGDGGGGGDWS